MSTTPVLLRAPYKRLQVCIRLFTDIREWKPLELQIAFSSIMSATCAVLSLLNTRTRLLALCRTLSHTCVHQCPQRQRCPKLGNHVSHQSEYSATDGFGPAGRAHMLCQVPPAGCLSTDPRRG